MNSYASLCDDFGVSTYLHGKLEMPTGRETVLHFFEAVQKAFPKMTEFEKRHRRRVHAGRRPGRRELSVGLARRTPAVLRVRQPADPRRRRRPQRADAGDWPRTTWTSAGCKPSRWTCCTTSTSSTRGTTTRWWPRRWRPARPLEGLAQMPGRAGAALPADADDGPRRGVPAPGRLSIETRTNAYQVRTGQLPRVPDHRVLHRPPVLGEAAVQDLRGVVPQPAPDPRRAGDELRGPEGHHPAGEDHRREVRSIWDFADRNAVVPAASPVNAVRCSKRSGNRLEWCWHRNGSRV